MDEHIGFVTLTVSNPVAPPLLQRWRAGPYTFPSSGKNSGSLERYPAVVVEGIGGILVPIKKIIL